MRGNNPLTEERAISVHIRIDECESLDTVRAYVDRSLQASFERFTGNVGNIRVTIQDVNGPRGGVDKTCRIQAKLFPSRHWVVHEVRNHDVFAAITLSIQRLKHTARKVLERTRVWHASRDTIRKGSVSAEDNDEPADQYE